VDEAPVSDAGSTTSENFRSVAAADSADVVAIGVELAHPAAVAVAVIRIGIAGGDCAPDHGGADKAGTDAPAPAGVEAMGLGRRDGGSNAAGGRCGRMPVGRRFCVSGSNPAPAIGGVDFSLAVPVA